MRTILITSMGGAGSLNLVETLRQLDAHRQYRVVGTHFDPYELAKSDLQDLFVVPRARDEEAYVAAHFRLIERFSVDLLIANSDKEVAVFATHLDRVPCKHLIPEPAIIAAVQDKYAFHDILERHGCPVVPNVPVAARDRIDEAVARLSPGGRFWIRMRGGSGSLAATWLTTAEQAGKWIDLWRELRGIRAEEFVLAPFLSGRDFCVSSIWQDGELVAAKVYERLSYLSENASMSMMGSTPRTSITVSDRAPVDNTVRAIEALAAEFGMRPHGLYQADLKCDEDGTPFVTEINIGRFPMTSPQFDRVGKYNLLELYLALAFEPEARLPRGVYDMDPGKVFLRGLDMAVKITDRARIEALARHTP